MRFGADFSTNYFLFLRGISVHLGVEKRFPPILFLDSSASPKVNNYGLDVSVLWQTPLLPIFYSSGCGGFLDYSTVLVSLVVDYSTVLHGYGFQI